ncbi:MAG: hypothetical protein Q8P20_02920 [bacterium]|nr:hypothetical protein [bacterium]
MENHNITAKPKCPHCNGEVTLENVEKQTQGSGFLKQEILYYCPHCSKILGFSRGKYMS